MSNIVRHKTNPFLDSFEIEKGGKSVKVNRLGAQDDVLIMDSNGEVKGTHLATYKTVDKEKFVKLFSKNIGFIFDLRPAGVKALNILITEIQNRALEKDRLSLDQWTLDDWNTNNSDRNVSPATFKRGLKELEDAKIIAKTLRKGDYFLNPNFVFNGDRIAFSTVIEKSEE